MLNLKVGSLKIIKGNIKKRRTKNEKKN